MVTLQPGSTQEPHGGAQVFRQTRATLVDVLDSLVLIETQLDQLERIALLNETTGERIEGSDFEHWPKSDDGVSKVAIDDVAPARIEGPIGVPAEIQDPGLPVAKDDGFLPRDVRKPLALILVGTFATSSILVEVDLVLRNSPTGDVLKPLYALAALAGLAIRYYYQHKGREE